MRDIDHTIANEKGSALVLALLVLVLLTLMGISATTTSTIEMQMAGNEKFYEMAFYTAESGWQRALNWLDGQYPGVTHNLVWGWDEESGTWTFIKVGDLEEAETVGISLAGDNNTEYYVKIESLKPTPVAGYGSDYRRFNYKVNSEGRVDPGGTESSITRSEVSVTAGKVFDMGVY
jgi:hypothetical protein